MVSNVMSRRVATIPWCSSMDLAAATLAQAAVSGAPVIDSDGRCIGVLTAADFLRFGASCDDQSNRDREWDDADGDAVAEGDSVTKYMSTVQSVTPETPLVKAAEIMCAQHIHRLIVLNNRAVPVGIVSTLDIVAALIGAAHEHRQRRNKCK